MKSATFVSALLASAAPLASADFGVGLDNDDVPSACKTICRPITRLSDICDVDLRSDIDRDEDHLQNQCICTNKSFDVANVAGLCAGCINQNRRRDDDDGREDINRLLRVCGFASKQYSPAATSAVNGVSVSAARLTDISQLTTTLGGPGDAPAATQTRPASSSASLITLTGERSFTSTLSTPGSQTTGRVTAGSGSQTAASVTTTSASASTSSAGAAATAINLVYVGAAALVAGLY